MSTKLIFFKFLPIKGLYESASHMYRDEGMKKTEWRKRKKEQECQPEAELNIDTLAHTGTVSITSYFTVCIC